MARHPYLAHTMATADPDRLETFASLFAALMDRWDDDGDTDASRELLRGLDDRVSGWIEDDVRAEAADVVALSPDDREWLVDTLRDAFAYQTEFLEETPDVAPAHAALETVLQSPPDELPRAALVRARRSVTRFRNFESWGIPLFVLKEIEILLRQVSNVLPADAPSQDAHDPAVSPARISALLHSGMSAVLDTEPGEHPRDIGLGVDRAVPKIIKTREKDAVAMTEAWASADHPCARHPFVPRRRLATPSVRTLTDAELDSLGPIGWATGGELDDIVDGLRTPSRSRKRYAEALAEVADRVADARRRGRAVVGCFEYLPQEAEGDRTWFVG